MLGAMIKFLLFGFAAVVVLGMALTLVGTVLGFAIGIVGLTLKLLPFVLLGYLVLKLVGCRRGSCAQVTAGERRWLDT
jgi:hypothetical protein